MSDPVDDRPEGPDDDDVTPRRRARRIARRAALAAAAFGAVVVALVVAANLVVGRSTDRFVADGQSELSHHDVAIVFGAGIVGDEPSPMLAQRVDAGVALYVDGTIDHLLMTGDNSRRGYDEVTVMRDRALAAGVPADRVTRDHAGFDTYDSCVRAREQFGVTSAVLVTQAYHTPRAVFTCRSTGMDAVGLRLPDWGHRPDEVSFGYSRGLVASLTVREWLASAKAVVDVEVVHPEPTFGGPYEGLGSDTAGPGPR